LPKHNGAGTENKEIIKQILYKNIFCIFWSFIAIFDAKQKIVMFFYSENIYYYRCFIRNKSKNIENISLL
ncbi:hypothetical protein, partial [Escherichia coli]|uniref:hypothetical protein n=1 Tax=Escherichia coli TaxID=562 RepID=UPI001BAFDC85